MTYKNILIVGGGSKFGANVTNVFKNKNYKIHMITGSDINDSDINFLKVDWNTCDIHHFEKFLKSLPELDVVIFNQNAPALTDDCLVHNTDTIKVWKRSKIWMQSHYVNCILPMHVLNSISKKLSGNSTIAWILSTAIFSSGGPPDYIGYKFQNYILMKKFAQNNPQIHVGICPGHLTEENYTDTAETLGNLLENLTKPDSGKFFKINNLTVVEQDNLLYNKTL